MADLSVRQVQGAGALSAEHYQTFEMAKANDSVLGGDDIAQIRSYAAFARAQAQAIHKSIATMGELEDVAQTKAEMNETSQTFAKVSIYADQRIGEILRELPTKQGARNDITSVGTPTKVEAEKQAGISHAVAIDLQAMAANPEVVEAVIAKAEAEGRIPSRKQITDELKRIKAEKEQAELAQRQAEAAKARAERERDKAHEELEDAYQANELLENENTRLKNQPKPQPEIIEREVFRDVVPDDYELTKQDNAKMRAEIQNISSDLRAQQTQNIRLRSQLDQMEKQSRSDAQRDIEQLTMVTNTYLRQCAADALAFDQFDRVDGATQNALEKAITNLCGFAQNMLQMINDRK